MLRTNPIKLILAAMVITFIVGACATNPQKIAYDNCMKEKIADMHKENASNPVMVAHFFCNIKTGHMTAHYFDCLPIATKKFLSDGVRNTEASAVQVCEHYARVCIEGPQNKICSKGYIESEYKRNPNGPYPGSLTKRAKSGSTLLIRLAGSADVDAVEAVIKHGANVNESAGGNWTPLVSAGGNQEMIDMLKRYGAK